MQVKWNKRPDNIIKNLENDVEITTTKLVEVFSKEIEVNARRNFNRAVDEISGDNPYVVVNRSYNGNSATITCNGEQVLFAEFGAGIENKYKETDIYVGEHTRISASGTPFAVKSYTRTIIYSARGFTHGGMDEIAPRPNGIDELGHYHLAKYSTGSMGMYDIWIRSTQNGRMGSMENSVSGRTDIVWTKGTRPIRALWRARNTAINKLQGGRLNVK